MSFFSYKDTVVETVESLKKSRNNINLTAFLLLIPYAFFYGMGSVLYLFEYNITGIYFFILSIGFLIIMVGVVLKREMYSIMIYLKEEK
jgi:hypothetical protein